MQELLSGSPEAFSRFEKPYLSMFQMMRLFLRLRSDLAVLGLDREVLALLSSLWELRGAR